MKETADVRADDVRPLAAHEFDEIRRLAYQTFGLDLKAGKEELVSSRLRRLVERGKFRSFRAYFKHVVEDKTGESLSAMIDALATNHTSFLREADHFRFLREEVLPKLAHRQSVELWTAACSTGEEIWTLGCILNEALPSRNIRILATDISTKALRAARDAVYPADRCRSLPAAWLGRYFAAVGRPPTSYQVQDELRRQVTFRKVNLVEPITWSHQFPVIFCRNVMIYFDHATQERVVQKLSGYLEPGGYLFVGHAESLSRVAHTLEYVRPAVYRKPGERSGKWGK